MIGAGTLSKGVESARGLENMSGTNLSSHGGTAGLFFLQNCCPPDIIQELHYKTALSQKLVCDTTINQHVYIYVHTYTFLELEIYRH